MACDLTLGRLEPCKDQVGGIKAIYFINNVSGLLDSATFAGTDQITAFATALDLFKYETRGAVHSFDEVNEVSGDSGTSFWTQTLTVVLKTQNLASRKELKLLSYGSPQIIIEDYNGNYKLGGIENGFDVQVDVVSGSAMGDLTGYNITATAMEKAPAFFVDSTIIDDTTNTAVTVGT